MPLALQDLDDIQESLVQPRQAQSSPAQHLPFLSFPFLCFPIGISYIHEDSTRGVLPSYLTSSYLTYDTLVRIANVGKVID